MSGTINPNNSKYVYPCLPWKNYNTRVGQFLDPLYYKELGSEHPGQDINGNGGGNTDWRDPVYSITDGIVTTVGSYRSWGNVVLIYHPGPKVWSQYAHLDIVLVKQGDRVNVAQQIGTIGRGQGNRFLAHLHFEIRYQDLPADTWPSSRYRARLAAQDFIKQNYVDPIKFLQKNNAATK